MDFPVKHAHVDVIKWKHFPRNWPFVRGIHRSPVSSPHKGQWHGAFMFSLICVWINHWVNNREADDLRRYRAHYYIIVMDCENFVALDVCIISVIKTVALFQQSEYIAVVFWIVDLLPAFRDWKLNLAVNISIAIKQRHRYHRWKLSNSYKISSCAFRHASWFMILL